MDAAQLQQALSALNQQQQQLQQQMQALQQQPQPQPAPGGAPPPRPHLPRIAPPSSFAGEPAAALDNWLRELEQQFGWYQITADADRTRLAAAHLRATALDWWASMDPATAQALAASWPQFEAALRARFQPVNSAQTARRQLDELRQGPRQSVHDYISAFRRILTAAKSMGEDDRVHCFVRGLRPAIATQLRIHGVATLDAAITMAARVGTLGEMAAVPHHGGAAASAASSAPMELDALESIEGLERETGETSGQATASGSAPVTQSQFQQLLNAMREQRGRGAGFAGAKPAGFDPRDRRLPKVTGLTPAQVKEYMDNGKCFGCGSKEHMSRGCPKKKAQGN
jgi:hypothetical protein